MGRPQTIHVDRDKLLANLCRLWLTELAAYDAELAEARKWAEEERAAQKAAEEAWLAAPRHDHIDAEKYGAANRRAHEATDRLNYCQRQRQEFIDGALPYDLHLLSGRVDLSPSERLRTNQALRSMEAAGLLEIEGVRATRIRPTESGIAKAAELTSNTEEMTNGPQP